MRRPLLLAAGAFVCFGMFWGGWAVAATEVRHYTGLSNAGLGLFLSLSIAAGGLISAAAGHRISHFGTDRILGTVLMIWGVLAVAASLLPGRYAFVVALALTIASGGLLDMAMNAASTVALGGSPGAVVRFHSLFNVGTLCGAATVTGLVSSNAPWRLTWLVIGVVAVAFSSVTNPRAQTRAATTESQPVAAARTAEGRGGLTASLRAIRDEGLGLIAFSFALTAVVEGGIDTWGVLFLRTRLATSVLVGAGAYAAGQLIATVTRAGGSPAIRRLGHTRGFVLGSGVAAACLVVEATSHNTAVAACALALAAGGISLCWPLTMARLVRPDQAGQDQDASTTVLVSGFTASGYMGWVLGPAFVGAIADRVGLGGGLILLSSLGTIACVTQVVLQRRSVAR